MKLKLLNDLDVKNGKKALEVLKNNTNIFQNWNVRELADLCEYMRFFSYQKSTPLLKKDETSDYFGIIISGRALVSSEGTAFGYLETGDMIGYFSFAKLQGEININQIFYYETELFSKEVKISLFYKLYERAEKSFFDIFGEKEGYIATVRSDDYKIMGKKSPLLAYKLSQIITKKALDTVNFQYRNEHIQNDVMPTPSVLPPKRIIDLFEKSLPFQQLFKRMDKRDRSNFLRFAQLYEFAPKDLICRKHSRCKQLIFLLKGEATQFNEDDESVVNFRAGDIIGLKEFYLELSWHSNIVARTDGQYLVIKSESFEDIALENGSNAINLYNLFASVECENIKLEFEKEYKERFSSDFRFNYLTSEKQTSILEFERSQQTGINLKNSGDDLILQYLLFHMLISQHIFVCLEIDKEEADSDPMNHPKRKPKSKEEKKSVKFEGAQKADDLLINRFLEIDVEKKFNQSNYNGGDDTKKNLEAYRINYDIAPLYVHNIHQHYIEQSSHEKFSDKESKEKESAAIMPSDGLSILYREKLEKQQIQIQKLKQVQRQERKEGVETKKIVSQANLITQDQEDCEELKNELAIIEQIKMEMERQLQEVKDENKNLRLEITKLNDVNILLNAKVNKNLVQRELVNKDILNQGTVATLNSHSRSIQDSFNTVLDQQIKLNRGNQLATKCAYRWLVKTQRNIVKKKSGH